MQVLAIVMTNSYNYVTPNIVITDISVPPESSVFPRHPLLRGLWLSLPAALVTCEFFLILNKVDQNNKHAKYCRHDPLSSVSSFVCLDFETGSPFNPGRTEAQDPPASVS